MNSKKNNFLMDSSTLKKNSTSENNLNSSNFTVGKAII